MRPEVQILPSHQQNLRTSKYRTTSPFPPSIRSGIVRMDITNFIVSNRENSLLIGDYSTFHTQLTNQLRSARKRVGWTTTSRNSKYIQRPSVTAEELGANHEYEEQL